MHPRRQYLLDLRQQLRSLEGYGGVWIQRDAPNRNAYPAITLFSENEAAETLTINTFPRHQERTLVISVVIWVRGTVDGESVEADMDRFSEEVETALHAPVGALDFILVSTDFQFAEDDADIYAVTLTYRLFYAVKEGLAA